ncbi:beta strand repeat-containing protein, partial [Methylobacterium tarhaniae]|uniref:beta strand repeat-containing protein n=1 Tax=Methylobacterium tarhaniae TaxID=1187852 RepID=UPI003D01302C
IAGYALGGLTKVDDTTYKATFTVTAGTDVAASADLPVSLVLEDSAGNASTAYTTAISQGGDAIDATRPTLVSATVNGTALVLTYGKALDATHGPAAGAFTVTAGGAALGVSGVAVNGAAKTVTLTLVSAVAHGQAVTIAYADPTRGNDVSAIQDGAGNDAETLSATSVTNTTPLPGPTITDAAITIGAGSGPNGAYRIGDTITATWNNTATGDNNSGVTGVTMDFSQFGAASPVTATNSGGLWTATYTIAAGTLSAANRNVSVSATDSSGSRTTADTTNAMVDNQAPAAPVVTSAALTRNGAPILTGTAETGSTVAVAVGGASYTTTATGGAWSLDLATATPVTGRLNLDTNGSNAISVTAEDAAGNVSTAGTQTLVIDTTAPTAPAVTSPLLSNRAAPILTGTAEIGSTVAVAVGGATYTTTATGGTWSLDLATAAPVTGTLSLDTNGSNAISVIATDLAGNVSATGTQSLVIDTTAPGTPAVTSAALTKSAAPMLTGTAEAGSAVTVTVAGATYATTATGGVWSLDLATATPATGALRLDTNGSNAISVTAEDAAGNVSPAGTQSLVIDTTAPDAPAITSTALTNSASPTLTGTAEANAAVTVTVAGATYATTATGGAWSLDLATATPVTGALGLDLNGGNLVSATAEDLAGNTSTIGTQTLVIDTTAPSAAVRFEDADISASEQADAAFLVTSLDAGDSFTWTITSAGGGQVSGSGTTRAGTTRVGGLDLSGLADGALTLTLGLTDPAGNAATPITAAARKATGTDPDPVTPPGRQTIDGATVETGVTTAPDGSSLDTVTIAAPDDSRVEDRTTANADLADVPVVRETLIAPQTGQATSLATLTVSVPTGVGVVATGNAARQTPDQALTGLIAAIKARTDPGTASQADLTDGASGFLGGLSSEAQLLVRTIDVRAPGVTPGQPVQMRVSGNTLGATTTPTALVFDTTAVTGPVTVRLDNVEFAAVVGNATLVGGDGRQIVYGDTSQQYLYLGADDDILHGGGGNDTVASAGGNDTLYGDAGEDLVAGGEGDDWLRGGTGRDTVFGETGDDVVFGEDDDDFIGAGSGSDFASGGYGNDEVHGEDGNDVLFGDEGRDGIYGEAGDDLVRGDAGDDFVSGGHGRDLVEGGSGNDLVYGDDDDDVVLGGEGDDAVLGGTGNDRVLGEQGADTLLGGEGGDDLSGGEGDDLLFGGQGADLLFGMPATTPWRAGSARTCSGLVAGTGRT